MERSGVEIGEEVACVEGVDRISGVRIVWRRDVFHGLWAAICYCICETITINIHGLALSRGLCDIHV